MILSTNRGMHSPVINNTCPADKPNSLACTSVGRVYLLAGDFNLRYEEVLLPYAAI